MPAKICSGYLWAALLTAGTFLSAPAPQAIAETLQVTTQDYVIDVATVADGFRHPWGLAFLPNGHMLVTEREGDLRKVAPDGSISSPLKGVPKAWVSGQGGMLDVAIDPDFSENRRVYLSYSQAGSDSGSGNEGVGTAVARGVLSPDGTALSDVAVIFQQLPKSSGGRHFGSRLVFGTDKTLFITTGDRGERERVQDLTINRGQIIRINRDGSIPADNPFVGVEGRLPEVWSYGHRNPQGAALNTDTGELWTVEHGARGGDEINKPQAGKNYGWPVISYGRHYFGGEIGEGTEKEGFEQPVFYWDPSIAPSGMAYYTGKLFPKWQGDLFVGALKYRLIARLDMDGDKVTGEERFLSELGERVRDIRQGPDGALYVLTDNDPGALLRLTPAE